MSDALAPCLLCKATTTEVRQQPLPEYAADPAYWVRCTTCGLQGPWRRTEAAARQAWNRAVTYEADPVAEPPLC